MKKYVVIGSSSFSGRAFIRSLLCTETGQSQILGISRTSLKATPFDAYPERDHIFQNLIFDLDLNMKETLGVIKDFSPDYIVNFASMSMVAESWQKPLAWYNTNLLSLSNLIDGLMQIDGIKKFIQFTTPEVYGSTKGLLKENWEFSPSTPYAISRAASDWHLKAFFEAHGFPVIFTRAANVYGEYQRLYRIIPKTIFSIITGRKLPLHGGGSSQRSFIHIDDVSDALFKIIESGRRGECYHISTNNFFQISEVIQEICKLLNADFSKVVEITSDRLGKDHAYKLDSSKLRTELNWQDKITFRDGVMKTFNWINENQRYFKISDLSYQIGGQS